MRAGRFLRGSVLTTKHGPPDRHPSVVSGRILRGPIQVAGIAGRFATADIAKPTVEVFAAIDRFESAAVETSEARLMRGWLEY